MSGTSKYIGQINLHAKVINRYKYNTFSGQRGSMMRHEKLISVIIPVYGVEKYIRQCLDSVVNQSYKNLEIIVVNDGTRDRSAEFAKEYAQKDNRIKVYDYENGGVSVARNRGLEHAKGDYISFVDGDDWLHPDFYTKLADALETNHADIAKCSIIETDTVTEKIIGFQKSKTEEANFDLYFGTGGMLWSVVWNALYKREIVREIRFPAGIQSCEDEYASVMYIFKATTVVELKNALYYYRYNASGLSKGIENDMFDPLIAFSRLKNDLLKLGCSDKRLDQNIALEVFHIIRDRGVTPLYRIKAIDKEWYHFVKENLNLRRKILLSYLVYKRKIDVLAL